MSGIFPSRIVPGALVDQVLLPLHLPDLGMGFEFHPLGEPGLAVLLVNRTVGPARNPRLAGCRVPDHHHALGWMNVRVAARCHLVPFPLARQRPATDPVLLAAVRTVRHARMIERAQKESPSQPRFTRGAFTPSAASNRQMKASSIRTTRTLSIDRASQINAGSDCRHRPGT